MNSNSVFSNELEIDPFTLSDAKTGETLFFCSVDFYSYFLSIIFIKQILIETDKYKTIHCKEAIIKIVFASHSIINWKIQIHFLINSLKTFT